MEVFDEVAKKSGATFLVQGTIYPDVIESAGSKLSAKIKSHHNVGGLPDNMKLALVEPLRNFYKDEVRKIGEILGLPKEITEIIYISFYFGAYASLIKLSEDISTLEKDLEFVKLKLEIE